MLQKEIGKSLSRGAINSDAAVLRLFHRGRGRQTGWSGDSAYPVIEKFEAHPPGAMAGDTITLRWRTRNAVSAAIGHRKRPSQR